MPPTIPVIQDSVQLDVSTGRRRAQGSPEAFGASEARGAAQVARGLDVVANVAAQKDDEFDRADAQALDNELSARIRDRLWNDQDGYFSTEAGRGRNAETNRDSVGQALDGYAVELAGQARSDRARALFTEQAQRRVASTLGDIAEHASRQNIAYENSVDEAALAEARDNIIAAYDDPIALAANLRTADGIIQRTAERNGLGPELAERARNEYRSDIFSRVIVQMAATDPQTAEEMFLQRAPDMTAQDRAEISSQMRAARRQAEDSIIDQAWTFVAAGQRVPPDVWARVPGRAQIDIQNEMRRRAEGGAAVGDRALISDLSVMAVAEPNRFAQTDLRAMRGRLGESAYATLAIAQARLRNGEDRQGLTREQAAGAMSLATRQLRAAGYDTGENSDDQEFLSNFQSDLVGLLDRFVEENNRAPTAQEQLVAIQNLLASSSFDPSPGFGFDRREWRATDTYTPFAQIPLADREALAQRLQQEGRQPTRGNIERLYELIMIRQRREGRNQ